MTPRETLRTVMPRKMDKVGASFSPDPRCDDVDGHGEPAISQRGRSRTATLTRMKLRTLPPKAAVLSRIVPAISPNRPLELLQHRREMGCGVVPRIVNAIAEGSPVFYAFRSHRQGDRSLFQAR